MKSVKTILLGLMFMCFVLPTNAQKTLEVGLFGGGSYYIGEMNPAMPYVNTQLAYGALARLNLDKRWSLKLSYSRGGLKGVDDQPLRVVPQDYSFSSTLNDISFTAEFNWWEYFTGSKKSYFSPYLFAGLGYYFSDLESGVAIPFGFGLKYSINERLGLGFEWGMRKTFSDFVDGVNAKEYQNGITNSDDNTSTWDWYNFTGITLTYKFTLQNRRKCNSEGF